MQTTLRAWICSGLLALGLMAPLTAQGQEKPKELPAPAKAPPAADDAESVFATPGGPALPGASAPQPVQQLPEALDACPTDCCVPLCSPLGQPNHRFWVGTDYLLWWTKPAPMPAPLLTSGSDSDRAPGALGQPGTAVLFGNGTVDFGALSGVRLNAGVNLDQQGVFAVAGSYLLLGNHSQTFTAKSDASGSPVLARPLFSVFGNGELSEATSIPGQFAGQTSISNSLGFQAWELNLTAALTCTDQSTLAMRLGFRQLGLIEELTINDALTPLAQGALNFRGAPIGPPSTLSDFDRFRTSNQFYGGQIGASYAYQMNRFSLEASGSVALGVTQQLTSIDGATALSTPGAAAMGAPGGILAQPTNIGSHAHEAFSAVPEANLALSYQVAPWLCVRVAYSLIYWTNVVRPGNTIDRSVNVNQVPSDSAYGTMPGGAARPQFAEKQTDFWAQGLNFGLTFSY